MNKSLALLFIIALCSITPTQLSSQTTDVGAIGSFSISKNIGRSWGVKLEQEFRFNNNLQQFDRTLSSISADYSIIKKVLKAEIDYDFIYQGQKEYFEIRQRSSIALATNFSYRAFDFELKTRGQIMWRDETRGNYKFNPKYTWRNKLECNYKIFGSPVKPFVSAEIFCPINSSIGFYMNGLRVVAGTKYRLSAHNSVSVFLRYDQDIQTVNPQKTFYGGAGWNYKL